MQNLKYQTTTWNTQNALKFSCCRPYSSNIKKWDCWDELQRNV